MMKSMIIFSASAWLAIGSAIASPGRVMPEESCEPPGYVVGFFNGVWNREEDAWISVAELRGAIGIQRMPTGGIVREELFYNTTGPAVGGSRAQDIAEVIMQRAREFDRSGELGGRWEFLQGSLSRPRPTWFASFLAAVPNAYDFVSALAAWSDDRVSAVIAAHLSNPPTQIDAARHVARIRALAAQGNKFLFVGHSQGNLFVNPAFRSAVEMVGESSVFAMHVAPPAPLMVGPHWLADIDRVIDGLRLVTWSVVAPPAANIALPASAADHTGHKFAATYLDPGRQARERIASSARSALHALVTPPAVAYGGLFSVALSWNGDGDVDLHAIEPDGTHVYYESMIGTSGTLDRDNITGFGPEHYHVPCELSQVPAGTYRFGINHYQGASESARATLQVATAAQGEVATRTVEVGRERGPDGNGGPRMLLSVIVSRDSDGQVRVSVP